MTYALGIGIERFIGFTELFPIYASPSLMPMPVIISAFHKDFEGLRMHATHRDAEERYTIIREAVLDELNKDFYSNDQRSLEAKLIDPIASAHSGRWNLSSRRKVDWDWVEGYRTFKL